MLAWWVLGGFGGFGGWFGGCWVGWWVVVVGAKAKQHAATASALAWRKRRAARAESKVLVSRPASSRRRSRCRPSPTTFPLPPPPCQQLIEGVTLVASALPDGQRQACVQQMLDIVVQPMQGILQAAAAEGGSAPGTPTAGGQQAAPASAGAQQLALVLPLMDRVTTIFRAVKDPADVAEALVRLWPWIEAALGALRRAAGGGAGLWAGLWRPLHGCHP